MQPSIDYRNCLYQGQLQQELPHGIGILLTKNLTFCIAEWQHGQPNGSIFIIENTGKIICGTLKNNQLHSLCLYELVDDHVQLLTVYNEGIATKFAAIMPLFRKILEIDNSQPNEAIVICEHNMSESIEENRSIVGKILGIRQEEYIRLDSYSNCIQFSIDHFLKRYTEEIEYVVTRNLGKTEYFIGLRGEGLGVRVEPIEELTSRLEMSGRVYIIRAMGHFNQQNVLKEIGVKTVDNVMKGVQYEEGVFSRPGSLVRYNINEQRPKRCLRQFVDYLRESLNYRDEYFQMGVLGKLGEFTVAFECNLKRIKTERIAQSTIEMLDRREDVERKRERERNQTSEEGTRRRMMVGSGVGINGMVIGSVVNSGRSEVNTTILGTGRSAMGTDRGTVGMKHNEYEERLQVMSLTDPMMDLTRAKEEIYRSVGLNKLTEGNLKEYRELPETGVTYGTEKGGLKEVGNLQDIRRRIQESLPESSRMNNYNNHPTVSSLYNPYPPIAEHYGTNNRPIVSSNALLRLPPYELPNNKLSQPYQFQIPYQPPYEIPQGGLSRQPQGEGPFLNNNKPNLADGQPKPYLPRAAPNTNSSPIRNRPLLSTPSFEQNNSRMQPNENHNTSPSKILPRQNSSERVPQRNLELKKVLPERSDSKKVKFADSLPTPYEPINITNIGKTSRTSEESSPTKSPLKKDTKTKPPIKPIETTNLRPVNVPLFSPSNQREFLTNSPNKSKPRFTPLLSEDAKTLIEKSLPQEYKGESSRQSNQSNHSRSPERVKRSLFTKNAFE